MEGMAEWSCPDLWDWLGQSESVVVIFCKVQRLLRIVNLRSFLFLLTFPASTSAGAIEAGGGGLPGLVQCCNHGADGPLRAELPVEVQGYFQGGNPSRQYVLHLSIRLRSLDVMFL
jgi:hypothetical protein